MTNQAGNILAKQCHKACARATCFYLTFQSVSKFNTNSQDQEDPLKLFWLADFPLLSESIEGLSVTARTGLTFNLNVPSHEIPVKLSWQ